MKNLSRFNDRIVWFLVYVFGAIFIHQNGPLLFLCSVGYWLFAVLLMSNAEEPVKSPFEKELYRDLTTSTGNTIRVSEKAAMSILTMLDYYDAYSTVRWCMKTYNWKREYADKVVNTLWEQKEVQNREEQEMTKS